MAGLTLLAGKRMLQCWHSVTRFVLNEWTPRIAIINDNKMSLTMVVNHKIQLASAAMWRFHLADCLPSI